MTATLTVGHMNTHNTLRAALALIRLRPDTAGLAESQRILQGLGALARYQTVVEPTRQGGGRGTSQEVPILTRKKYPSLGRITLQVSEDAAPSRIAPERWLTVHLFSHPIGAVAHFNIHPNAGVNPKAAGTARVREYAESMTSLDRLLTWAREEGFRRVLTSDINLRDMPKDPAWSPYPMLAAQRMETYHISPIDIVAADRALELVKSRILAASSTGTDHPGGVLTFQ